MSSDLLVILIKNSIRGKVKTRLAVDLGDDMALKIYRKLVIITLSEIEKVKTDKWILFSDFIEKDLLPTDKTISTGIQEGNDLGNRMLKAFFNGFKAGYQHICIIGSDCYEINSDIIHQAFSQLRNYDFVLGPAHDGGYYLLGLNVLLEDIFLNKQWSTSNVLKSTLEDIKRESLSCFLLRELIDVDTKFDLELLNIDLKTFMSHDS